MQDRIALFEAVRTDDGVFVESKKSLVSESTAAAVCAAIEAENQKMRAYARWLSERDGESRLKKVLRTGEKQPESGIAHLLLHAPIASFAGVSPDLVTKLELVDTPGRNEAANPEVGRLVDEILVDADALVFAFNWTTMGTQDEETVRAWAGSD